MYKIEIVAVLNGWIVTVGCKRVVFDDLEKMLDELGKYIKDPAGMEKLYRENSPNPPHHEVQQGEPVSMRDRVEIAQDAVQQWENLDAPDSDMESPPGRGRTHRFDFEGNPTPAPQDAGRNEEKGYTERTEVTRLD